MDPDDEPKPDAAGAAAGWADDEPNVNAAGADGTGGVDDPGRGGVDAPKPKTEAAVVAGAAPNAGALVVADVVVLWPKVKPVEDGAGADVAGADVAGFEPAAEGPNETAGVFDSASCPKPVFALGAGVDEAVDDDPKVNPVVGAVVSVGFVSGFAELVPKLKLGAASIGLSAVVELLPNENEDADEAASVVSLAGTCGGFDGAPKENAGVDASGFESDAPKNTAERFAGRSDSFGLVCFESAALPKLKPDELLGFDVSVVVDALEPKLKPGAESVVDVSASGAFRLPLLELSPVVVLVAPNVNPLETLVDVVADAPGAEFDVADTPKENDGADATFSATAGAFAGDAPSDFLVGAENPNEIGAVLAEPSALTSDAVEAPKLKPPAAGLSAGRVKLNPPGVIPVAGLSASFFVSATGAPKLKPVDEIDPAGFSVSFFEAATGAPKLNPPAVIDPEAGLTSSFFVSAVVPPKLKPLDEITPGAFGAAGAEALFAGAPPGLIVSQHGHLALVASFKTLHPGHFHCPGFNCMNLARGFTAPLVGVADGIVLDLSTSLGATAFFTGAFGFSGSLALGGADTHSVTFVLGDGGMKSNGAAPPFAFDAVFWLDAFIGGSRMLGGGENINRTRVSSASASTCFAPSTRSGSVNLNSPIVSNLGCT